MSAKVLFVDDDEGNLVVSEAHCGRDFDVLTCTSAEQAIELMAEHEVGVIIADQRMPGTTGVELLSRVRVEQPDVVRLLITAYSDLAAAIAAINRGHVRRYIRKPWEPAELKAELKDAMAIYEMSRKVRALSARLRGTERVYSLGVIAASVGHELRNPVGWVRDNVEHVKAELLDLQRTFADRAEFSDVSQRLVDLDEALADAQAGTKRILEIVHGIELPNQQMEEADEVVDLGTVVELSLKLASGELRRRAKLSYDSQAQAQVRGNQTKIGQILLNLVINAMQALVDLPATSSIIHVVLRADESWAYLSVADSGRGVPISEREKIFDPFYTTKGDQGTGLGLAICQQLAIELGGALMVEDDPELGGAQFILKLPLYRPSS